ncbi:MAG TPA: hypothetical protein DCL61_20680 [Cyanobacteria bacterium UBA12227]|nr:hypothetical protein [Cyanobacteria bacterium UBA12227]HAX85017.1 hypothetical protein [Cyanobacteria bacterium UBA11370]HBY81933.1 hypothetical protein [Cyanobacteria bacterium UBA11148]
MTLDAQRTKKVSPKAELIAGLLFLILLVLGCAYRLGQPLTCQQAKEAWQKNELNYSSDRNPHLLNPALVNRDTIHLCR